MIAMELVFRPPNDVSTWPAIACASRLDCLFLLPTAFPLCAKFGRMTYIVIANMTTPGCSLTTVAKAARSVLGVLELPTSDQSKSITLKPSSRPTR